MAVPTWVVVISTITFFALTVTLYYFVLKPIVYKPSSGGRPSVCPNKWIYNPDTQMCEPAYMTKCQAFNPTNPAFSSASEKCEIANECGTNWSGIACS